MTSQAIDDLIKNMEYNLARLKTVQAHFPNVKVHGDNTFSDKNVNRIYTHFRFESTYGTLSVIPYYELPFTFNGKEETIVVFSAPRRSRLAKIGWRRDPTTQKKTISFSRLAINMKNNQFKDDMLNSCKAEIMNFIKNNPGHLLDTKHLEPRLKKLLMFT